MRGIGRQPCTRQEALDGSAPLQLHRPEQTTLYRLVQQHAARFIAHTESSAGFAATCAVLNVEEA